MEDKREVLTNSLNGIRADDQKQMIDRVKEKYSLMKLNILQAAEVAAAAVGLKEEKRKW